MNRAGEVQVRHLTADEAAAQLDELASILADCVNGGASVSFMPPFTIDHARAWWPGVIDSVGGGGTILFGAFVDGKLVGTAQLIASDKPNQRHRADVAKVLVHRRARGRGVGAALMEALEGEARDRAFTLLTLDTATGSSAERLYLRQGWTKVGIIPNYALWPDGRYCNTSIFWKAV